MMWPEPELRAIIRPEPEMKNRSLHSTSEGVHLEKLKHSTILFVSTIYLACLAACFAIH
jgi:hypothetical protein